ncbi:MAG: hypothetical protein JNL57_01780 [Bacteroidetes bacterium]|nr:hypothetical protein [Bacteroidota bacterium]
MKHFLFFLLLGSALAQTATAQTGIPATEDPATQKQCRPAKEHDSDLNWALELLKKYREGYRPTEEELTRYTEIFNRYQPTGADSNLTKPEEGSAVHDTDLVWAQELQKQIEQGYKPTQEEITHYTEIFNRHQPARADSSHTKPEGGSAVHDTDLVWAMELQKQTEQGYKPTREETDRYTDIYNRYQANGADSSQTKPQVVPVMGVSQQELQWAMQLEEKVKNGYTPAEEESMRYQNIYTRLNNSTGKTDSTGIVAKSPNQTAPTQQEIQWALDLEQKTKDGYKPTPEEIQSYQQIAVKLQSAPTQTPAATVATQEEINWALELENRVKSQNYQPTAQETAKYEGIAKKLAGSAQAGPNAQAWANPYPVRYTEEVNWALEWLQKKEAGHVPTVAEEALYSKYKLSPDFRRELETEARKRNIRVPGE